MHASQEGSSLSSKREHPHHPRPQAHLLGSPTCCSQPPHPSQHPSICLNHGPSTQNTPRRRAVAHPGAQSLRGSSLHPPCMHTRDNSSPPTTPCSHSIFSGHSRRGKPQEQCLGCGEGARLLDTEEARRSDATGKHPLSLLLTQTLPLNHSLGLRTGGLCKHIACFPFKVHNSFLY